MEDQYRLDFPWTFDEARAERPISFMENFLAPTKGDYDKLHLMPWQCFCEMNLYGWISKETGLRRFNEGLIVVGRGNGKSTLMSGNATYGCAKDGEPGADVYLLANTKQQAAIVYDTCRTQIASSPKLAPHFRTLRDGIHYDATHSRIQHRASDSSNLDGLNPYVAIFDEIHEQRDFKLINVIKRGMVKRKQPLLLYITTMGTVLDGALMQLYTLYSDMLDGRLRPEISDRMFGMIYELDAADDVNDSSLWIKANPSMGELFDLQTMKQSWERARFIPQERADFICKQLNIFANTDDLAYVDYEVIERNTDCIDMASLEGAECYGGFDLSASEDFTSAALLFPMSDGRVFVMLHSWTTRKKVELDQEKIPYYEYALNGWLTISDGEYITQDDVYAWFVEQAKHYEIRSIGYDPANATMLVRMLETKGFAVEVVRQGALTLNAPMKSMRERLLAGGLVHNNNPLMRWYLGNVRLRHDADDTDKANWVPTKRNRYRKIDGFMAMLDAYTIYERFNPTSNAGDIEPGISVLSIF